MPGQVPPVADERAGLLGYLAHQRYVLRLAAHGLTDEQARATPTASALSVGGLLKHVASVERGWMDAVSQRQPTDRRAADYQASFQLAENETLADVLADFDRAGEETTEVIAGIADLNQPVPIDKSVPWNPKDVDAWSVRWVLLHLIEEIARHAGHADIVRESVDEATAYPLMAAVEGWPETPWLTPWRPESAT
ncbi:MAG: DinB family protein [Sciscionella sp.]|nr:DinB family protein [Sciscionella sp.]